MERATSPETVERRVSLPEVHGSVETAQLSLWRRMFAFAGPAYLVSVGYMDPGNWATDLGGGAQFGYGLLWVLVLSNAMAILLQTLAARLGIVTQRDLAQACREAYPRPVTVCLWLLCEVAIAACDLAEVLGAAIALDILFHIPLVIGVLLTALDTLLVLWFTRYGIRLIESFVLALVAVIAACFLVEIWLAGPNASEVVRGLVPHLNKESLYLAIGIIGATVMPHNLYLHSALVQTRRIGASSGEKRAACRYNFVDSFIALNGAMLVNCSILILAAALFFKRGIVVTEIAQAHLMLSPLMGTAAAGVLFGIALLCSGQSSTLTGTMAGQIVMEGFLHLRMRPWLRRLVTRAAAVIPAALTVWAMGETGAMKLIILSQVILNLQLPFAIIPLIHFTSKRNVMREFASPWWLKTLAWISTVLILGLDGWLVWIEVGKWIAGAGDWRMLVQVVLFPALAAIVLLMLWITFEPVLPAWLRRGGAASVHYPRDIAEHLPAPVFHKILVPLDHSSRDRAAITHAAAMARAHGATVYLLHVEEDVTSQMYGQFSSTAEVEAGREYLEGIAQSLEAQGIETRMVVRHSNHPRREIVNYARALQPDLVVMGAHGHKGLKDVIFGATINAVRHDLPVPLMIVRSERERAE